MDDSAIITVSVDDASSDDAYDVVTNQTVLVTLTDDDAEFTLDISIVATNVTLSWSTNLSGLQMQMSTNLLVGFTNVVESAAEVNGMNQLIWTNGGDVRFFRLLLNE